MSVFEKNCRTHSLREFKRFIKIIPFKHTPYCEQVLIPSQFRSFPTSDNHTLNVLQHITIRNPFSFIDHFCHEVCGNFSPNTPILDFNLHTLAMITS